MIHDHILHDLLASSLSIRPRSICICVLFDIQHLQAQVQTLAQVQLHARIAKHVVYRPTCKICACIKVAIEAHVPQTNKALYSQTLLGGKVTALRLLPLAGLHALAFG